MREDLLFEVPQVVSTGEFLQEQGSAHLQKSLVDSVDRFIEVARLVT